MAKVHERIVQLNVAMVAAADTLQVTAINYFRDRGKLDAGTGQAIVYTPSTAQTSPAEIEFGEMLPPPTKLRFVFANF